MNDTVVREERRLGEHTTVLFGKDGGKYPEGNALLVEGADETVIIDPSLGVLPRAGTLPRVDRVINSHCHEDHVAGNHLFPDASWHLHEADWPGMQSLDAFMAIYGFDAGPIADGWKQMLVEQFHVTPRPDAVPFRDGDVFELGGGVRVRVIHTPGHTRGHSALLVEPDGVLYLGDIDLSSFGPYYGDAWSELEDFERSLERVAEIDAQHYATFHHIGVVDRATFETRLARYAAVIGQREQRLLAFLAEPHSLDEIVAHRFVYRPQDAVPYADPVERRSMGMHLDRLVAQGRVAEAGPGRFQVCLEPASPQAVRGPARSEP